MEDYHAAFLQRGMDVKVLEENGRRIATLHFGGITIECLLKDIILTSLPKGTRKEWMTDTSDPGHTVTNPGHSYQEALKRCNILRSRIQHFPQVQAWLNEIENPDGHFINMRYAGNEPDDERYKRWLQSYKSLLRWLQTQATKL